MDNSMTDTLAEKPADDLVKRLLASGFVAPAQRMSVFTERILANPDGPEAAAEINRLRAALTEANARVAELESEAVSSKLAHDCGFNAGCLTAEAVANARVARLEGAAWELAMKAVGNGCGYGECTDKRGENCECGKLYRAALAASHEMEKAPPISERGQ